MTDYLKNNICKFTPLFEVNTNKKKNLLSAVFFKMPGKGYKDLEEYIDGLEKLALYVKNKIKDFSLRLFIDRSVYEDEMLLGRIEKHKNIEVVVYGCPEFIVDDIYHQGLFGTMVRYFPMFNFPNNDARVVIPTDIDYGSENGKKTLINIYSRPLVYIESLKT